MTPVTESKTAIEVNEPLAPDGERAVHRLALLWGEREAGFGPY